MIRSVFGARGQIGLGCLTLVLGAVMWPYIEIVHHDALSAQPVTAAIFRVSMYFGLVACYALVGNALGYLATERVERYVAPETEPA